MAEDRTITSSYRWTIDELATAYSMHEKVVLKRRRRTISNKIFGSRVFIGFIGIVALSRLVLDVIPGNGFSGIDVFLAIVVVAASTCFAWPWLRKKSLVRHFEKRPDRDKIIHFAVNKHKVTSGVEGLSEGNSEWSAFAEVVRTPEGFLFYPNDHLFHWLPNHAFASPEDADALAGMAREYAPKYWDPSQ
jgi:hypothetical protein